MCVNSADVLQDTSLMNEVANELNSNITSLNGLLKKIGDTYHFENGFIYQGDYKNNFNLMENYVSDSNRVLDQSVSTSFFYSVPEINDLIRNSDKQMEILYFHKDDPKSLFDIQRLSNYDGKMFVLFFVFDQERKLIAEIGFCNDENDQIYSNEDLKDLKTLITMLVFHVRNRIAIERTLATTKTLESIMNNTGFDIYVNDYETHEVLYANESMAKPYGGIQSTANKKCYEWLYKDKTGECEFCPKKHLIDENGNPTKIYSWDYQRPMDGAWFRVMSAAFEWTDGRVAHVVSSMDITENKKNQQLIKEMAYLDALTQIPNRRQLEEDVNEHVTIFPNRPATMLFIDLNNFKSVNDNYGHKLGDSLLVSIAKYLNEESYIKGHAYRYAGDEFIVFFPNDEYDLNLVIESITERFSQPWSIQTSNSVTKMLGCSASFGYSSYPQEGKSYAELLDTSDQKMYQDKHHRQD